MASLPVPRASPSNTMTDEIPEALKGFYRPLYPVSDSQIDWLQEMVAADIDSRFTADVACCEACYEGFHRRWPGSVRFDRGFHEGAIALDSLLDGARRVNLTFSPEELSTLRHYVRCPRCLGYVRHNLWAYNHPFDGAEEFEQELQELEELAHRTPFLLLEHEFPRRVLAVVRRLAAASTAAVPPRRLFRARKAPDVTAINVAAFGPPPAELVAEGRYNHAGAPMLYLADEADTAFREVEQPGVDFIVGELHLLTRWKILDLQEIKDDGTDAWDLLNLLHHSALGSAPRTGTGWVAKEYAFTRFVGDCAKAAGFDAIRYGSTKGPGSNYVVLEPRGLEDCGKLVGAVRMPG